MLYSLSDVYQVADTEYMEAETLAKTFAAAVAKLPSAAQLTLSDKDDVKNLKTYYDNLNSYQQSKIDTDTLKKISGTACTDGKNLQEKNWYKKYFIIDRIQQTDTTNRKQIQKRIQTQRQGTDKT